MLDFTRYLRETVTREIGSPGDFFQESLDMDRFPGPDRAPRMTRYIERHRGTVSADNDPAGGAVFRVRLPARAAAPGTAGQNAPAQSEVTASLYSP